MNEQTKTDEQKIEEIVDRFNSDRGVELGSLGKYKDTESTDLGEHEFVMVGRMTKTQFVKELSNLIKESNRKVLREIWEMSKVLYNRTIEKNDIAMSNYGSLCKINKKCAEYLSTLEQKEEAE